MKNDSHYYFDFISQICTCALFFYSCVGESFQINNFTLHMTRHQLWECRCNNLKMSPMQCHNYDIRRALVDIISNVIREIILFKYLQQIEQGLSTQSWQQSQYDDLEIEISIQKFCDTLRMTIAFLRIRLLTLSDYLFFD